MMKKIFIAASLLTVTSSIAFSSYLATGLQEKYENTLKWSNSSLLDEIDQVPPSLARNYITHEEKKMFQILTETNIALEEIVKNSQVLDEKEDYYWDLLKRLNESIEENSEEYSKFTDKFIVENFTLYLKADKAIKNAYGEFELEILKEHSKSFSKRLSKRNNDFERKLFNELKQISEDYVILEDFSQKTLAKLGTVQNGVLQVNLEINEEDTSKILEEINVNKLDKFVYVKKMKETLQSPLWKTIVYNNKKTKEYKDWMKSKVVLEALSKDDYILVGTLKTTKDILAFNPSANLEYKKGYTIDDDSKVNGIFIGDRQLDDNMYMKKSAHIWYSIDYKYTKTPEQEALEYVQKAYATRIDEDIAAAKEKVANLKDSEDKKQLGRDIENLIAIIKQEEIDRIKAEEKRLEDEIRRKLEEELERERQKELEIEEREKEEEERRLEEERLSQLEKEQE